MSDEDDSLSDSSSGSGGDTDELIAASQSAKKNPSIAVKKKAAPNKRLQKKNAKKSVSIPDADADSDSDDAGLFDSDDDSDDDSDEQSPPTTAPKRKLKKSTASAKPLSKREKMEALQAKRRSAAGGGKGDGDSPSGKSGYDSADSYDSAEYVRTKEDDDFIDFDDEDEEAQNEYNREQIFDDERPVGEDSDDPSAKKRPRITKSKKPKGPSRLDGVDLTDLSNPVTQVLQRMKKKTKKVENQEELKATAGEFLREMERAADEDDRAIKERKPAMKRLQMLPRVVDMMTQRTMTKILLDQDLLGVVKRWIQPLPNGTLGNVTLREKLINAIAKIGTGEEAVTKNDLKQSDFGKLIMQLFMHKKETPMMKRKLKGLIEEYSREVFGKSDNMKDLRHAQSVQRHDVGLAGISRAQALADAQAATYHREAASRRKAKKTGDLGKIISKGTKASATSGKSRVSVPYSKGFRYTVRPQNMMGDVSDRKNRGIQEKRQDLHKRIVDRGRQGNSKSGGNLSIEGRAMKN